MKDFIKDLSSPYWWLTAALAGVFFNVVASYLRDAIDKAAPRVSSRLRLWTRRKVEEFSSDIDRASGNLPLLTFLAARHAGYQVAAIQSYLVATVFLYFGFHATPPTFWSRVFAIAGFLFTLIGAGNYGRAQRCKTILDDAQNRPNVPRIP